MKVHWLTLIAVGVCAVFVVIGFFIGRSIDWPTEEKTKKENSTASWSVKKIVEYLTTGNGTGLGYDWLANITDAFGSRMVGSKALESAIDTVISSLEKQGFDNVHSEPVLQMPYWKRGEEQAVLRKPRLHRMAVLGVGGTVPTKEGGLTAPAVVVRSFEELEKLGRAKVQGSIVVFNQPWKDYGRSAAYRSGANEAVKYGALATLIRSVTSFSVYSPHTGVMGYTNESAKIAAACITVEDAQMLWRMQERGEELEIFVKITSNSLGTTSSRNTVFELKGTEHPEEIVLLSGHFDSWDVGEGAMDDGAGCAVMWQAVTALKNLGRSLTFSQRSSKFDY